MAIKTDNIGFTGTRGGICGYFSHGRLIYRAASSLCTARVKKDPAFKGFRDSSNRMKDASPIAAGLYNLIPKEEKQFTLYRLLTGEAIRMIKQGIDKATIIGELFNRFVQPFLEKPVNTQRRKKRIHTRSHIPCSKTDILITMYSKTKLSKRKFKDSYFY